MILQFITRNLVFQANCFNGKKLTFELFFNLSFITFLGDFSVKEKHIKTTIKK